MHYILESLICIGWHASDFNREVIFGNWVGSTFKELKSLGNSNLEGVFDSSDLKFEKQNMSSVPQQIFTASGLGPGLLSSLFIQYKTFSQ